MVRRTAVAIATILLAAGCYTGSRHKSGPGLTSLPQGSVSGGAPGASAGSGGTPTGSEVGLSYSVTFEADVDRALMQDYGAMLQQASAYLWTTTEGQAYLKDLRIEDRRFDGDIRIARGVTFSSMTGPGNVLAYVQFSGTDVTMFTGGKNVPPTAVNHELGHLAFYLPDEYQAGVGVDPCVMSLGAEDAYCDRADHRARGFQPCWDDGVIPEAQQLYGATFKHPNPNHGAVPATTIAIVDN